MVNWSERKRASYVALAGWPHCRPLFERWFVQERGERP
jgi:hypothetical protein